MIRTGTLVTIALGLVAAVATASPVPTHVARVGIDPAGTIGPVATAHGLVAWSEGRELMVARLLANGTLETLGSVMLPGANARLAIIGNLVATVAEGDTTWVDISEPAAPMLRGGIPNLGSPYNLVANDSLLVVALQRNVVVWRLLPGDQIERAGVWTSSSIQIRDLALAGTSLVVGELGGVAVVDLADPERPVTTARLPLAGNPSQVDVAGSLAVVALPDADLSPIVVIDLAAQGGPAVAAELAWLASWGESLQLVGTTLVATSSAGTVAVDLSNPAAPRVGEPVPYRGWLYPDVGWAALASDGYQVSLVEPVGGIGLEVAVAADPGIAGETVRLAVLASGVLVTANRHRDDTVVRALARGPAEVLTEHGRLELAGAPGAVLAAGPLVAILHGETLTVVEPLGGTLIQRGSLDLGEPPLQLASSDGVVWVETEGGPVLAVDLRDPDHPVIAGEIPRQARWATTISGLDAVADLQISSVRWWGELPNDNIAVRGWPGATIVRVVHASSASDLVELPPLVLPDSRRDVVLFEGDIVTLESGGGRSVVDRYALGGAGAPVFVDRFEPSFSLTTLHRFGPSLLGITGPAEGHDLRFAIPYTAGISRPQFADVPCGPAFEQLSTAWPYLAFQCGDGTVELFEATEQP